MERDVTSPTRGWKRWTLVTLLAVLSASALATGAVVGALALSQLLAAKRARV